MALMTLMIYQKAIFGAIFRFFYKDNEKLLFFFNPLAYKAYRNIHILKKISLGNSFKKRKSILRHFLGDLRDFYRKRYERHTRANKGSK